MMPRVALGNGLDAYSGEGFLFESVKHVRAQIRWIDVPAGLKSCQTRSPVHSTFRRRVSSTTPRNSETQT